MFSVSPSLRPSHPDGPLDRGQSLTPFHWRRAFRLRFPDVRALYFSGDTNVFSDMQLIKQVYHPALAFLPIGDLYHEPARGRYGLPSPQGAAGHPDAFRDISAADRTPRAVG